MQLRSKWLQNVTENREKHDWRKRTIKEQGLT